MGRFKSVEEEIKDELRELKGATGEFGRRMKLPVVVSREECQKLITAFTEGKLAFRNNLIVRSLYATGVRIEELEDLRFADVNYAVGTVFIRSGKGDKDRYVCADKGTLERLKTWQGEDKAGLMNQAPTEELGIENWELGIKGWEGKKLEDSVFGLTLRQLRRIVERAADIVGIPQRYKAMGRIFSPHSLRHAFATHSYENGMRVLTLKKLLGHEFLGTTEIYIFTSMKYDLEEYRRTAPLEIEN